MHDHVLKGSGAAVANVVVAQPREGVQQVLALARAAARGEHLRRGKGAFMKWGSRA